MTREAVARHDGREISGYLSPPSRPLSPGKAVIVFVLVFVIVANNMPMPVSFPRGGVHKVISKSPQAR